MFGQYLFLVLTVEYLLIMSLECFRNVFFEYKCLSAILVDCISSCGNVLFQNSNIGLISSNVIQ